MIDIIKHNMLMQKPITNITAVKNNNKIQQIFHMILEMNTCDTQIDSNLKKKIGIDKLNIDNIKCIIPRKNVYDSFLESYK